MVNNQTMPTILETSRVPGVKKLYVLSLASAIVSGLFCLAFVLMLWWNYHLPYRPDKIDKLDLVGTPVPVKTAEGIPIQPSDPTYRNPARDPFNLVPTDYKKFLELKQRLAADKQNESLKEQIRQLDQKLRLDFFKRREMIRYASPLLLIAAVIFLVSVRTAAVLRREIPVPQGDPMIQARQNELLRLRLGLFAVVGLSMMLVGLAAGLFLLPTSSFEDVLRAKIVEDQRLAAAIPQPATSAPSEKSNPAVSATVSTPASAPSEAKPPGVQKEPPLDRTKFLEELAENWSSFRGFEGNATGRSENPPLRWDGKSGENIIWKTEIPLPGKSSPVIWGNRLFITGADQDKRQVYCFDTESGKRLWTADAPSTPESLKPIETTEDTGYAAPTMVLDGRRAFALFANGDLVAVDFDGKVVWSKSLGIPESHYGFSSSPVLYFDRLIVQYDVGDGTDGKSKLYAFDVKTGNTVWETAREMPNSWSSPIVHRVGEKFQIITCGDPFVIAYDPEDGKEIWRFKCLNGDVGPSPAAFGSTVYITNQSPQTTAIDATGTGDVSKTKLLWKGSNALPDTPSPIATEKNLMTFDSHGYLTVYDPANVKKEKAMYWELEVGGGEANFYSSPLLVGKYLYAFDKTEESPKAFVVDLSKAAFDDKGALTEEGAEAMRVAANPMPEPCVASPAVLKDRLYMRGTQSVYCIGTK